MQRTSTNDVHIDTIEPLITPVELAERVPVTIQAERTVLEGRRQVTDILDGVDPRMLMVVGPCSIHDESVALDYAQRLHSLAQSLSDRLMIVMRVYFEKPRTTVGWKGFVYDPHLDNSFEVETGLQQARRLLLAIGDMGLYAGTEFLDPVVPQYLAGLVSWATIGARTTESQTHRQMASGLSMPVGFKNATDGNAQIAVDAMITARAPHCFLGIDQQGQTSVVYTTGNPDGHMVLRGGNNGPNYGSTAIAQAQELLVASGVRSRLLVDCSHGNSNKEHSMQGRAFKDVIDQRSNGNLDIIGCMLESNINEGNQKLNGTPADLKYGISITDSCIGWSETEELLKWAYERVLDPIDTPIKLA